VKFGELPTVAVDDIAIQPRERDLVVATHGRSLFIVDDIRPLEELTAEVVSKDVHLFSIRSAYGFYPNDGWVESSGSGVYRGANPPVGALIDFLIKDYRGEPVKISITNASGRTVANLTAPGTPGLSRVVWDLKPTKDVLNDYGGEGQKFMKSGDYTVTLNYGKLKETQTLHVEIAQGIETR
jgi:glycerol kinase